MKTFLFIIPDLTLSGGIASYYNAIHPYLSDICDFFVRSTTLNGTKRILYYLKIIFKFPFELYKNDYKYIVLNTSLSSSSVIRDIYFSLIAKVLNKNTIVFIRGWVDNYFYNEGSNFRIALLKFLLRSDKIIVLSKEFKSKLEEIGIKSPIVVETTTVNENYFTSQVNEAILERTISINDCKEIVFLSRIEIYKGIYEIISAFEIVQAKIPKLKLKIIGYGKEYNNLIELISKKNISNIKLLGYLDGQDKFLELAKADTYIFLSYSEGMPNSVLEAMACGLPVITTPVGGVKDFFIDGVMGYFCSFNPDEIASLIQKLCVENELRLKIGKTNRVFAMNNFASSKVAYRIRNILLNTQSLS